MLPSRICCFRFEFRPRKKGLNLTENNELNVHNKFKFKTSISNSIEIRVTKKQTPWPESASELYRPSDSRLSAELLPTFSVKGCRVVHAADSLRQYSRFSRPEPLLFLSSSSSIVLTRLSGPRS
jgi:hypothetical protein